MREKEDRKGRMDEDYAKDRRRMKGMRREGD